MMLMHAAVTVWVDRGQGGGCARHLGTRAQKSFGWHLPPKKVGFSMWWVCAPLAELKKVLGLLAT